MNYPSNPGVGETVNVLGLKGQYIIYAIIAIVAFIVVGAVLSNMNIPILLVILILIVLVTTVLGGIIRINKRYGQNGIMKVMTLSRLPKYVKNSIVINKILKEKRDA